MPSLEVKPRIETSAGKSFSVDVILGQDLRNRYGIENCPVIRSAADIAKAFGSLASLPREVMMAGSIDSQCRLVFCNLVSVGAGDGMMFRTSDVFFGSIRSMTPSFFLVHNHPSGSLRPSTLDIKLTQNIAKASRMLGLEFVDHVIVSFRGYRSLVQNTSSCASGTQCTHLRAADARPSGFYCPACGEFNSQRGNREERSFRNKPASHKCRNCSTVTLIAWNSLQTNSKANE